MPLADLPALEQEVVRRCVAAAAGGPFFPDLEFHTLFGLQRAELHSMLLAWPPNDEPGADGHLAIHHSLVHLLGYPHGREEDLERLTGVDRATLDRVFLAWRASFDASSDICERIVDRRQTGKVTCAIHSLSPAQTPREVADAVLSEHGFSPLAAHWREIDRDTARRVAAHLIHQDLAYRSAIMPATEARELADAFIGMADASSRFLTNATWRMEHPGPAFAALVGWASVSNATLDVGLVWVGAMSAGILWVEDED